ncbi:component of SufBCD complex [Roseivivax sp. CAU 1753]
MDWHLRVFEVIDMRSFSNLWFWIALAVMWSSASHWVLGVPFDMVARAAKRGGQAEIDLEDLVRINANRILYIAAEAGLWLTGLGAFMLSMLCLSGFVFGVELAQALFLLGLPMSLVGLLSMRTSRIIRENALEGADLRRKLTRHRVAVQAIGMVSIFITALWGMYRNMSVGPFGG